MMPAGDNDVDEQDRPPPHLRKLMRALSNHDYRRVAYLIEEMITQAIDEHEAVNHGNK